MIITARGKPATYGSEFVAARVAVDQIIEMRITLRYFGVPVQGKAVLYGDNQSMITSSTLPHSKLSKRHNALAYHQVREAVAAKILGFYKIDGNKNVADILSKHWSHPQVYPMLQPLLFQDPKLKPCKRTPPDKPEDEIEINTVWWELRKMIIVRAIGEY